MSHKTTVMAVVNQKGGTGKTTTCENLGDTYGTKLKVYKTDIPRSVRAEEIRAEGKSIFEHDPKEKLPIGYLRRF